MKKIQLYMAVAILSASLALAAGPVYAASVNDVDGHWAKEAIVAAMQKGYVDGYEDGSFKPDRDISRAEFIKLAALATGLKVTGTTGPWYEGYITVMKQNGILPSDFAMEGMDEPITRKEVAEISVRAVDAKQPATMKQAVDTGLLTGVGNGELDAAGKTTRAQAVTVIERILQKRAGKDLPVDKAAANKAAVEETGSNIESMLGLKAQHIREKFSLDDDAYVMIDQVVIADPANPDDPFLSMFDMEKFPKTTTPQDSYILGVKYVIHVGENANKDVKLYDKQHFPIVGKDGNIPVKQDALPSLIKFDQPGDYIGWISATLPKVGNGKPRDVVVINVVGENIQVADRPKDNERK